MLDLLVSYNQARHFRKPSVKNLCSAPWYSWHQGFFHMQLAAFVMVNVEEAQFR
jgi:hypothetical protein